MRQKSVPGKEPATEIVKKIRRATRRHFSAVDKIRIVTGRPARRGQSGSKLDGVCELASIDKCALWCDGNAVRLSPTSGCRAGRFGLRGVRAIRRAIRNFDDPLATQMLRYVLAVDHVG